MSTAGGLERSLDGLAIVAMVFKGQSLVAAAGIDASGRRPVLGLRQGAAGNAAVLGSLLGSGQLRLSFEAGLSPDWAS
jgi:hypothetical protein